VFKLKDVGLTDDLNSYNFGMYIGLVFIADMANEYKQKYLFVLLL